MAEGEIEEEEEEGFMFCMTSSTGFNESVPGGINLIFKLSTYKDVFVHVLFLFFVAVILLLSRFVGPVE